jgi:hypothetical protein
MSNWTDVMQAALGAFSVGMLVACSGERAFQRVEDFPAGPQIDYTASAFGTGVRTTHVSDRYHSPYEAVWLATKRVVERVEQTGIKPKVSFDESKGLIVLTEDHRDDAAKTMNNPDRLRIKGWRDEIRIEVVKVSDDRTKVTVSRTVLGMPYDKICLDRTRTCKDPIPYEPEVSNGKVEDWILTQIEDAVATRP